MGDSGAQGGGHFNPGYGPSYRTFSTPESGETSPQAIIDNEHLRLLRIGYFISAGQTAFFIPFGLLYAGMGVMFSQIAPTGGSSPPPAVTWILGVVGGLFALGAGLVAALKLLTAIRLKERRSRVLCLVSAAFSFLEIPYGTALGIMTFIVLARPGVREQFERTR